MSSVIRQPKLDIPNDRSKQMFILPESLIFVFDVLAVVRRDKVPIVEEGVPSFRPRFKSFLFSDVGRLSSKKIFINQTPM
jgi:hypothetical protein